MRIFTKFILILFLISVISLILGVSIIDVSGVSPSYIAYVAIVILSVALFAAGSILEPIEKMKEAFEKAVKGELETVEVTTGDEFEELASAFNWMVKELRRERDALKESEERFRSVVEKIDGWVFELDRDLRIIYTSPKVKDYLGYNEEEVLGRKINEILENFPVDLIKNNEKFEFELVTKTKKVHPVEVTVSASGDCYRCFARSIEERKKIERELAFFRGILEHSIDAIVILDIDSRIVAWNRGAEIMFGYTAEEAIGKPIAFLLPEDQWNQCRENFRRAVLEGHVKDIESVRYTKSGDTVIVDQTLTSIYDSTGELVGFVAIMRDITRRKKAEIELKNTCEELERRTREILEVQKELYHLASIVENSNDAIYSVDLEGKITSWNRTAEKMFGWSKDEAIGMDSSDLLPDEIKNETDFILRRLRDGDSDLRFETRRLTKSGDIIDVEIAISPLLDEVGVLRGFSVIARDISLKIESERDAERRMLRYEVERGRVYFTDSFDVAVGVINDLIKCGYDGKVISRRYPEVIGVREDGYLMMANRRKGITVEPDPAKIYREIVRMPGWKNAVLLDLDYLLVKWPFEEVYELLQRLKDLFFVLNKGILIAVSESGVLSERELKLLKMECGVIRSKGVDLPEEMYELLRFVYSKNRFGEKPSIKDIMSSFNITRNTAKKRISYLVEKGLIKMIKDGRMKVLEVTEDGREVMRAA
ncbi:MULTISPECIES: PAS domain S-box protein [unclassified Archaeoglobus]|jgi:PAS domain S-box-containing protein|uniref:PAS domain S-box protein n=1 Tax=unclassified Archaeoglobus TaxID=2643606 RepID=UPI0025C2A59D|nr:MULTISPECIES: PAS domain S-box protein [unclassified Archaeoglobus]